MLRTNASVIASPPSAGNLAIRQASDRPPLPLDQEIKSRYPVYENLMQLENQQLYL
jgi:hypothetical protein